MLLSCNHIKMLKYNFKNFICAIQKLKLNMSRINNNNRKNIEFSIINTR